MTKDAPENKLLHECFPQVDDSSTSVWRYLDLAKFIWLLEKQRLFLPRLDLLGDPYEGSTPTLSADARDEFFRDKNIEKMHFFDTAQRIRKSMYVSCWNLGDSESEAMWRLYCGGDHGVAIRTTYEKLVQSIDKEPDLYIGKVTYIDYKSQIFPANNVFYPVMHKRLSFSHEREVRMVKSMWTFDTNETSLGIEIPWVPESTIEGVYVNPYAPSFYHESVRTVIDRLAPKLNAKLFWSEIRAAPRF